MLRDSIFNFDCLDILRDPIGQPCINLLSIEFSTSFHFQFGASRYITGLSRTSVYNVIVVWICYELPFSIWSILIYYGTQSDIRVQSYYRLNFLRASDLNFECLDILPNTVGHPSKKLLSFELARSFCYPFPASWYISGLNRTSELKVIAVCICYEFHFSISSISKYYWTESDIRVKSYCRLKLVRASIFNLERLDILRDSVRHPCIMLLSFEFCTSFHFQFGASRYITGLNRTFDYKVIVVWNCSKLLFSISRVLIYYGTQSDIWE